MASTQSTVSVAFLSWNNEDTVFLVKGNSTWPSKQHPESMHLKLGSGLAEYSQFHTETPQITLGTLGSSSESQELQDASLKYGMNLYNSPRINVILGFLFSLKFISNM